MFGRNKKDQEIRKMEKTLIEMQKALAKRDAKIDSICDQIDSMNARLMANTKTIQIMMKTKVNG